MAGDWKRQRIQDHFVVLCNELDVDRIVPVLRAEKMLTLDEFEQLTNPHFTTQNRRQKLLLFIPRKGSAHFEKFSECLVWSGQTELASKIGVPVKDIRPSPHPPVQQSPDELRQEEFQRMVWNMLAGGVARLPHGGGMPPPPPYPAPASASTSNPPSASTRPPHSSPTHVAVSRPIQATDPSSDPYPFIPPRPNPAPIRPPQPPYNRSEPDNAGSRNVFILYCNDEDMGGDFSDSVRELADFLTRVCGQMTQVHFDLYLTHPPSNWTRWTERQIKESDSVLLVCSKTLKRMLDARNPDRPVPMKHGHFDAETVYNLIRSPKFIPVFVNHTGLDSLPDLYARPYQEWVPSQLLGAGRYWVDLEGLHRDVRETATEEEYRGELARVLGEGSLGKNVEPIRTLLRVLQGVPDTHRPAPFPSPIIPPPEPTPRAELVFTDGELQTVAGRIPQDWQTLGIKLGIIYPTLQNIRYKHVFDVQQAVLEMLQVWRAEKGERATRTALRDALGEVGYSRLADEALGKD